MKTTARGQGFMPKVLLVAVALGLGATHASAQTYDFSTCGATGASGPDQATCDASYSGGTLDGAVTVAAGIQTWTVPDTGSYRITVVGAQGAAGDPGQQGGAGAQIQADLDLTAGTTLQFVVGQQGTADQPSVDSGNGGGGGGGFVVSAADSPLLVAGGGGGTRANVAQNGCDASTTTFGIIGSASSATSACTVKAVAEGLGGIVSGSSWGSAGAGFNGDGATDSSGQGGRSWANGMLGGDTLAAGGFGGGGSGEGSWGGGGGGGYSGGDGGRVAGGGGSYADASATNVAATAGVGSGDGSITVTALAVTPGDPGEAKPIPVMSAYGLGVTILGLFALATRRLSRRKIR